MSLYKYFTTNCDTVRKAYSRPSTRKQAIESDILWEMVHTAEGHRYRVLGHSPHFFTCAYMYTDEVGFDVVRTITKWSTTDTTIYYIIPEVETLFGKNGYPNGEHKMSLAIGYEGGNKLNIPYHELADDYKPLFKDLIDAFGYPVR